MANEAMVVSTLVNCVDWSSRFAGLMAAAASAADNAACGGAGVRLVGVVFGGCPDSIYCGGARG